MRRYSEAFKAEVRRRMSPALRQSVAQISAELGYRWLNSNRSWMYGVNAGYDSRPMATGQPDTGITVTNSQTLFFQQVAAGLEAVSNTLNFNAYALVPVGETEKQLNSAYDGVSMQTYGLDAGYNITPELKASIGYYYQNGDLNTANGSGVRGTLAYNISNRLTADVTSTTTKLLIHASQQT